MSAIVVLLASSLVAAPPSDATAKPKSEDAPKGTRVIDPTYVPQVGDHAFADTGQKDEDGEPYGIPGAVSVQEFITYLQLSQARNDEALDKMEDAKKVNLLDAGTEVVVTAVSPIPLAQVRLPQGTFRGGPVCAEIKVIDGEFKGQVLYALARDIVRYTIVPKPSDGPPAKSKSSKRAKKRKTPAATEKSAAETPAANPTARAESMLKLGQSLEKAGKTTGAVEFYRKVVKQFPDSASAKTAAGRLKALENK